MQRQILAIATALLAATASAGTGTPNCDALDRQHGEHGFRLDDANIALDGDDLVLRSNGVELVHIDAQRKLFVSGRPVAVPDVARADLEAYVAGFRKLESDAKSIGKEGGRIAAHAVSGLVDVLFTSTTMDDYEAQMEARGAAIEAKADKLCLTVGDLRRTEQALQQRIPAFPNFLSPANPAL